jgi:hypothetical protein
LEDIQIKAKVTPPLSDKSCLPSTHLVLWFGDLLETSLPPLLICEVLNMELPPHTKIAGVNFSHAGNIMLYVLASSPASLLAEHIGAIAITLGHVLGVIPVAFDLGEHLHYVKVPVPHYR